MFHISQDQNTLTDVANGTQYTAVDTGWRSTCDGCAFRDEACPTVHGKSDYMHFCGPNSRDDGNYIIWVLDDRKQMQDNTAMTNTTQDAKQKSFGYTHKIEWTELHKWLGVMVDKKFYTTEDALEMHLSAFAKQGITPTVTVL